MGFILFLFLLALAVVGFGGAAFEVLIGTSLLTTIIAFVLGQVIPLTGSTYGALLFITAGIFFILKIKVLKKPAFSELQKEDFYTPVLFFVVYLCCWYLAHTWADFYPIGERLRDYALLNSSYFFPTEAKEPWFSGHSANYYLFWYRYGHFLSRVFSLSPWETYHSLLALPPSLLVTSCYLFTRRAFHFSLEGGVLSGLLITFGSNPYGIWFFTTHPKNDTWWGPSRVVKGAINEFPAWSFLLGDLHPHYLNQATAVFFLLVLVNIVQHTISYSLRRCFLFSFLIPTPFFLYAANAWEVPFWICTLALLSLSFYTVSSFPPTKEWFRNFSFTELIGVGVGVVIAALLFYSSRNIAPADTPLTLVRLPVERTTLRELFLHWGMPLVLSLIAIAVRLKGSWRKLLFLPILLIVGCSGDGFVFLVVLLLTTVVLFIEESTSSKADPLGLGLFISCLVLLIFPELFFFNDPYGGENERMNTIFKVYFYVWPLLFLGSLRMAQVTIPSELLSRAKVVLAFFFILCCGFFLNTASSIRIEGLPKPQKGEGLSSIEREFTFARQFISELRYLALMNGPKVFLEADGDPYSYTSHVGTLSGNELYLGWANHIELLSREYSEVNRRKEITKMIYSSGDCEKKKLTLETEKINYVVLGPLERQKYHTEDSDFFCLKAVKKLGKYSLFQTSL